MADVPVPFNLKHFEQVTASMLNWLASVQDTVTDFNVGSVNRTLVEAVAMEMEELYFRMFKGLEDGIPVGVYLTFDFDLEPAVAATGTVTFSRSTPADANYAVPAGTIISTSDDIQFYTLETVTLNTGQTSINVGVAAVKSGSTGNVNANTITLIKGSVLGIESVTNAVATVGGVDQETSDARKLRFQEFISTLARTPLAGLEAGAKTAQIVDIETGAILEYVQEAKPVEPFRTDSSAPRGVVKVYIDNGQGTASASLVAKAQEIIEPLTPNVIGYAAAGIVVDVLAVTPIAVNVTASLTIQAGFSVTVTQAAVTKAIGNYFTKLKIGETLDWETLLTYIRTAPGIKTCVLTVPAADVVPTYFQRLIVGTVTLS